MKYRCKPEVVEAFRMSEDSEITGPTWFLHLVRDDGIMIDRILEDGATRVIGCTVYQDKNRIRVRNGDYLIRWKDGTITAEPPKRFKRKFAREGGGNGS